MSAATDLPIVTYSTKRYVDAETLSRIKSHAQRHVQSRKGRSKTNPSSDALPTVHVPQKPGMQMTFRVTDPAGKPAKQPKKQVRTKQSKNSSGNPVPGPVHETKLLCGQRLGGTFEPFDVFPVAIDGNVVALFERYYEAWKWKQSKEEIFRVTVSDATLCHSWLAVAYCMTIPDAVKAIEHEIKTIDTMCESLNRFSTIPADEQPAVATAITWAMLRLASIKSVQGNSDALSHINALPLITHSRFALESSQFSDHFQYTIALLLLYNISQLGRINALVRQPYKPQPTSALQEADAEGFTIRSQSPVSNPALGTLIDGQIWDILQALMAVCHSSDCQCDQARCTVHSKTDQVQLLKLALRLAGFIYSGSTDSSDEETFSLCLAMTALLFILCCGRPRRSRSPLATSRIRADLRKKLSPALLHSIMCDTQKMDVLKDVTLWMLVIGGSTADTETSKLYYLQLLRIFAPNFLDSSFKQLQEWGSTMPWINGHTDTIAKEFWSLTAGNEDLPQQEVATTWLDRKLAREANRDCSGLAG